MKKKSIKIINELVFDIESSLINEDAGGDQDNFSVPDKDIIESIDYIVEEACNELQNLHEWSPFRNATRGHKRASRGGGSGRGYSGGRMSHHQAATFALGLTSSKEMNSLDPKFKTKVEAVFAKLRSQGHNPGLGAAWRSEEDQLQKEKEGKSQVKVGKHSNVDPNTGARKSWAADVVERSAGWGGSGDTPQKLKAFNFFEALGAAAAEVGGLVWGGTWSPKEKTYQEKTFNIGWDPAHIELAGTSNSMVAANLASAKKNMAGGQKIAETVITTCQDDQHINDIKNNLNNVMIDVLNELQNLHEWSSFRNATTGHKRASSGDGGARGGTSWSSSGADSSVGALDYTPSGTAKKMNKGVLVREKQANAWEWLSPFLPDGSRMTSGGRTQTDQDRIIRSYAKKKGYTGPDNLDAMHKFTKKKGLVIARKIGTGHGSWEAFDVSGAPLNQIESAVNAVSADPDIPVTFSAFKKGVRNRSIVEKVNNAVHVGIVSADPVDPDRLASVISKYTGTRTV
jgi:hypothetical protein